MVKINRIYTRGGDDGTTGLVSGERISKDSLQVSAYGDVDELNSTIGLVHAELIKLTRDSQTEGLKQLLDIAETIQHKLFDLGATLASPISSKPRTAEALSDSFISAMEHKIDEITATLPELTSFVLPGGSELCARLHLARTVARRAERSTIAFFNSIPMENASQASWLKDSIKFLNRLSDLLFAMTRSAAFCLGVPEYLWVPGSRNTI